MDIKMADKQDFTLERYKYILERKQSLNEATFKIAAIYQVIIVALGLAQFNVIAMTSSKSITLSTAEFASTCLLCMLAILTLLIIALLLGGIFSWLKYRSDERNIEIQIFGKSREPTSISNIFRWYETYIALIVILVFAATFWTYIYRVYPLLKSLV
nr:hypothetical protein CLM75_24710 [Pseudomonas lurida]